jgi:hypothetical protein
MKYPSKLTMAACLAAILISSCVKNVAKTENPVGAVQTGISINQYGAVGDGIHFDDTAITKALAYAGAHAPCKVIIPPTFAFNRISHSLSPGESELVFIVPAGVTVMASGATIGDTTASGGSFCFRLAGTNSAFIGGLIKKGRIEVRTSNATVDQVRTEYSWYHAFHIDGDRNTPTAFYQNITISNCIAYRSSRHGFAMHRQSGTFTRGSDSVGNFLNVKFINCKAYQSDFHEDGNFLSVYDYGFGMENIISATDVLFQDCYSYKSAGAGYHVEKAIATKGITFVRDTAVQNGQAGSGSNQYYPFGFMYKDGMTYIDCFTQNNLKSGWASIAPYTGGITTWVNCKEDGWQPFSYSGETNQRAWSLNLAAYGGNACSRALVSGALQFPMYSIPMDYFSISKSQEFVQDSTGKCHWDYRDCLFNDTSFYDPSNRYISTASQPIKVDPNHLYTVKVDMRTVSGNSGSPFIYLQEYDKNYTLINRGSNHYTLRQALASSQDTVKTFTITFGHSVLPFSANTVYARVTLVEAETGADNKRYSVSRFSIN